VAQRYVKITDLLVERKKGGELEMAIAEWEKEGQKDGDAARPFEFHSSTSINVAHWFIDVCLALPRKSATLFYPRQPHRALRYLPHSRYGFIFRSPPSFHYLLDLL
jgi:hypothetical protein